MKSSLVNLHVSRSTSVDTGRPGFASWTASLVGSETKAPQSIQRLNPADATYPVLTENYLAQYQSGCVEKSKAGLCGDREIDPSTYITLHKNITIGKFAVYYFGTERKSQQPRVVKIFRPSFLYLGQRRARMEKQILSLKSKPGALPVLHFAFTYQFYKCLVLEPMYNESLQEKLLYARRLLPDVVQSFMVDIVCAVAFLHLNRIIHRNLSLNSFWIQANHRLKLTDYNYCAYKRGLARWKSLIRVRPTQYTAPELFAWSPYSRQTDIWAMGVIFYRMTTGRFPFYGCDPKDLRNNIMTRKESYGQFFGIKDSLLCSDKWQDIIQLVEVPQMLEKQPALRIGHHVKTDIAFLEHPYFSEIYWDSAHLQNDNGPPILWKFGVSTPSQSSESSDSDSVIHIEDLDTFDANKMKIKPLRMDAIRGGSFKFSPEYLEELFPHLIEDEDEEQDAESETDHLQVMSTPSRSSHMMRYSLHTHLHEAFMDLERVMNEKGNEEMEEALENYYAKIGKKITKYSEETKGKSQTNLAGENHGGAHRWKKAISKVSKSDEESTVTQSTKHHSTI